MRTCSNKTAQRRGMGLRAQAERGKKRERGESGENYVTVENPRSEEHIDTINQATLAPVVPHSGYIMIPVKQLQQCAERRQVYFGLPKGGAHAGLGDWVSFCNNLRKKPNCRQQDILYRLEKIRFNVEMCRKVRDWHVLTVVRRKARVFELQRQFFAWRKLFLLSRFKILHAILDNVKPLCRFRFLIWKQKTLWLRAVEFQELQSKRRMFDRMRAHFLASRRDKMQQSFSTWKRMLIFLRKLKRISILEKLMLKEAWVRWRRVPAPPPPVEAIPPRDASKLWSALRRWMLNKVRPYFDRWKQKPIPVVDDFNCVCIAKICRGQHCDCRKDVHFRRRLQYCFQEVEAARDDKLRIKSELKKSKQILRESTSAEKGLVHKRAQFTKRVATVSENATAALNGSARKNTVSLSASKHRPSPYRGVGEAARRSEASGIVSPDTSQNLPFTPPRAVSPERLRGTSPVRLSGRKGLLHSLDGVLSSHNRLRHSCTGVDEDLSHWDLKHLQVHAPDLTQYNSLEF